jgi:hypothetical protein
VQRRGVEEQPHTIKQRQDRTAGQAEGMKHRQHVEQLVAHGDVDPGFGLGCIGVNVAV